MSAETIQGDRIQVERPRSPRRRVCFKGSFESLSGHGEVSVRNVSCTGMMVEGEGLPAAGKDILLTAAGIEFFGKVVWSDGARCGIAFDEPLPPHKVLELHRITPEQVRSQELNAAAEWYRSHYGAPL